MQKQQTKTADDKSLKLDRINEISSRLEYRFARLDTEKKDRALSAILDEVHDLARAGDTARAFRILDRLRAVVDGRRG